MAASAALRAKPASRPARRAELASEVNHSQVIAPEETCFYWKLILASWLTRVRGSVICVTVL